MKFHQKIKFNQAQIKMLFAVPQFKGYVKRFSTRGNYTVAIASKQVKLHSINSVMDNRLMTEGIFYNEPNSKKIWMEWCANAARVCDIGANIGQFTLMALSVNPEVRVLSIEPFLSNVETLKRNVSLNQGFAERSTILNTAVGKSRGQFELFYHPGNPLTPSLINKEGFVSAGKVEVLPLQEIVTEKLDAIKIDVEGAEIEVIEGMLDYLAVHRPKILIEILDENKKLVIEELLKGLGYSTNKIKEQEGASKNYLITAN